MSPILDPANQIALLPFHCIRGTLILPQQPWTTANLDEHGKEIRVCRTLNMEGIMQPGTKLYGQPLSGRSWAEHPQVRAELDGLRDMATASGGWFTQDEDGVDFEFLIKPRRKKTDGGGGEGLNGKGKGKGKGDDAGDAKGKDTGERNGKNTKRRKKEDGWVMGGDNAGEGSSRGVARS